MAVKLGDLLLKAKLITQDQLDEALKSQREEGGKIGEALVRVGAVTENDITETLSQQFGVPSIDLASFEIDPSVIKIVPGDVARKYGVLPVNKTGATLTIAMGDPTNVFAMDDIKFMTGYNVEPVVASEVALRKAIARHYGTPRSIVLKERSKSAAGPQEGSRPGDRFDRPRQIERVRPDHQAFQPHSGGGAQGGRLRHPRRALRKGVPGPVSDRRHSPQHHGAPDAHARPADLASEDHGQARHLGEAAASGRPHQDPPARGRALA